MNYANNYNAGLKQGMGQVIKRISNFWSGMEIADFGHEEDNGFVKAGRTPHAIFLEVLPPPASRDEVSSGPSTFSCDLLLYPNSSVRV